MRTESVSRTFFAAKHQQGAMASRERPNGHRMLPALKQHFTETRSRPVLAVPPASPEDLRGEPTPIRAGSEGAIFAVMLEKYDVPKDVTAMAQVLVEALASRQTLDAERRCTRAESQRASAEAERASAEKRWGQANVELKDLSLKLDKADQVARKRYFDLLLLKGSVHLREEINIIEREYASLLKKKSASVEMTSSSRAKSVGRKHFSRIDIWTFFFEVNNVAKKFTDKNDEEVRSAGGMPIMDCCVRASRFLNTPREAALQMDRILTNLNTKFHRALSREEIKASGGIPLVESDALPLSSCRLLECVFDRESKDTKVYLEGTQLLISDPTLDPIAPDEDDD